MYTVLPATLFVWAVSQLGRVHGLVPASSAIAFEFNSISMTSCNPSTISWEYTPALGTTATEMYLSITNSGVPQVPSQSITTTGSFTLHPRMMSRRDDPVTVSVTDVDGVNPEAHQFIWSNVSVPAGSYILQAFFPLVDTTFNSSSFLVSDGCSAAFTSSSGPSTSSTPTSSFSSSASPSSSGGTFPVDATSSRKVNRGAIAGGVIGGLAVVAAAIAAYFYLRFASGSNNASPRKRPSPRKWGGLGSFDSKSYPSASRASGAAVDRHHSQTDSLGPMLDNSVYVIGSVGIDSRPSRINDNMEDEVDSYFSPSQEKISSGSPVRSPFSDSGHIDLDDVPMDLISSSPGGATSNITRHSSTSTSSYMNNYSRPRSHPSSPHSESPFSNPARNTTTSTLGHSDPSTLGYAPSPSPAYPSGTSQTISETPLPGAVRRTSAGETIHTVTAAAAGAATGSRRTPRKPVPQYNPTDPELMASSRPVPAQSVPQAAVESDSITSSREGSLRGTPQQQDWPSLSHKASFGAEGRAVHYLMPDMPLPQSRD